MTLNIKNYFFLYYTMVCNDTEHQELFVVDIIPWMRSDTNHQELLIVDIIPWCEMTLNIKNYLLLILHHGVQ